MKIQQISVFLENKPGHLNAACRTLAEAGIDIRTLTLADTREFGILRIIVKEWEQAKSALEAKGFVVRVNEILAIEVTDRPGGLQTILDIIDHADLNVEYMYAFTYRRRDAAVLIFRFNDPDAALNALQTAGVGVVGGIDLFTNSDS